MSIRELIIEGARQNNLKNINLRLPHNKIIAVTGVSGSGKSSLAFDTIFAEGQWRFIESLSSYARLFIEKLDRPDVDAIYNIRPAIALEQKNSVKGSRSTVGTITELYDLFRILYSKTAAPYCPECGKEIRKWDASQIISELLENHLNERAVILFQTSERLESLKQRGFHRIWIDNEIIEISEITHHASRLTHYDVVLDRLVIRGEPRLSDSIEMAWKEGKERLRIVIFKENERLSLDFSSRNSCDGCNIEIPEPSPILFSFNHPVCACPVCKGFGNILIYDEDLITPDKHRTLSDGAIALWERPGFKWWRDQMIKGAKKSGIDVKKPYSELTNAEREIINNGNEHFYGIKNFFEEMEGKRYKIHVRVMLSRYRTAVVCPKCGGKRLCDNALAYKIEDMDIAELAGISVAKALNFFEQLSISPMNRNIAKDVLSLISAKLRFLDRVGLGYLTINRQAKTLSGGEYQRVNLSNQLASALTGTLYVLDEPTIGLHPRDTRRIIDVMRQLSSLGNTIIVVEHDRDMIRASDWIVELGPGGGHLGGEVVFSGPMEQFLETDTLTSRVIKSIGAEMAGYASATKFLKLLGASGNNLKNVDIQIPLNALTVVAGVSGAGKSSLIIETLYRAIARHFKVKEEHPLPYKAIEGLERVKGIRLIDQSPIGRTPRSNPMTYLKLFDPVRKLYAQQIEAKAHNYSPGFFSFNVPGGRCETCKGEGFQRMEMYFFEDVFVKCEDCNGRRYKDDVLRVTYKGKNISDVLNMTVDEAAGFFSDIHDLNPRLKLMKDIGLGYLRLGQPATTLSGGEAQRLKICAELNTSLVTRHSSLLYIMDEPTVGLHHNDIMMFINIIKRLVDTGNTVVIIEHNLDVMAKADWVIDMGPEGGEGGGNIIFEGLPEDLRYVENSYTGQYL
ncbi:MAG: excinuclease ABC subunit UvrA, partial [Nitrospirae bacterium]|nr:excinuclease ABC subunit UvrA [Nitrospirota bacterium]